MRANGSGGWEHLLRGVDRCSTLDILGDRLRQAGTDTTSFAGSAALNLGEGGDEDVRAGVGVILDEVRRP